MHWAAHLIGAPYEAGACGPTSFDCIGLVRHYFKARHGVALRTDEGIGLLHAVGTDNHGSVVWQPLSTLAGYRNLEAWRSPCKL